MNCLNKAAVALIALILGLGACEREGPAERAGEKADEAAQSAADAFDSKGPAERAGEKMDKMLDQSGETLEEAGDRTKEKTAR